MKWLIILLFSFNTQAQVAVLNGISSENAASYKWKQVSGDSSILLWPDSVISWVDFLTIGERIFELTCTNEWGESRDSVMITVVAASSVVITNAKCTRSFFSDVLSWNVTSDTLVNYYLIEKSSGATFSQVTKVTAKGAVKYSYSVFRLFSAKPVYRVTPAYKDGSTGTIIIFK